MKMSSKATRKIKKQLKYIARRIIQKNIITIHGVTLNIEHQSINKNLRHHFYKGTYEGEELRVLKKVLTSSDRVLEIGAGIGFLSAFCAKLIGDNNVVAYEANPQMIQKFVWAPHGVLGCLGWVPPSQKRPPNHKNTNRWT